jgi:hypothetical protein
MRLQLSLATGALLCAGTALLLFLKFVYPLSGF